MAAASAPPADSKPSRKGPGLVAQAGVLLVLTGFAAGMGWFAGGRLGPPSEETVEAAAPAAVHAADGGGHGEAEGGHGDEQAPPGHPTIIPLAPINTNLAAPDDVWVRMDLSLEFAQAPEPGLADSVHQDLLAFIRTVKLHQVEGPSGFLHLKADLDERAKIRSGGTASRVLIRTLLFE